VAHRAAIDLGSCPPVAIRSSAAPRAISISSRPPAAAWTTSIENFTRLESPGDNAQSANNDVQWVSVEVDPRDPELFSFQQEVVPANVSSYVP